MLPVFATRTLKVVPSVDFSILYPVIADPCADGVVQSKSSEVVATEVITSPVTCAGTSLATAFAVLLTALVPYVLIADTL